MRKEIFYVEEPSAELRRDQMEMIVWESAPHSVAAMAHTHSEIELLYILDGHLIATTDGRQYALMPGDLILFRGGAIHHIIALETPRNRYYCAKIKTTLLQNLSGHSDAADYTVRLASERAGTRCLWKREELEGTPALYHMEHLAEEFERQGYGSEIAMKCHVAALILCLLRDSRNARQTTEETDAHTHPADRDSRLIIYLHRHFTEELDERTLAAHFNVSYGYFPRWFKRASGMTFKQYLNHLRLNYAEQLLLTSDLSVTEIASACGYNNVAYFISLYRRHKGITPKKAAQRQG